MSEMGYSGFAYMKQETAMNPAELLLRAASKRFGDLSYFSFLCSLRLRYREPRHRIRRGS